MTEPKPILDAAEANTDKPESSEENYFSDYGQHKKHQGTEDQKEIDRRT